ncbi:MAG: T9SS type A sorting domain-containing protein [Bacteroidales bacterium]|nr:T9SS type A sorting domain-containing protein [Bacteroidales bacterium]MCF8345442.1 T9SS type A sorting domain-containing protein [Bacteroidales bacterium]MCF8351012.1 T9SS type A sorting domain-containing protein [Bacteroidales bacterium]MCF8377868.1 T9SS type A sorting domain-containing protein [Bacteroidales bacterium]
MRRFIILILLAAGITGYTQNAEKEYYVRISQLNGEVELKLQAIGVNLQHHDFLPEGLAVVDKPKMAEIARAGIPYEIVCEYRSGGVDPEYHTYGELWPWLDSIAAANPTLTRLDTLGYSQFSGLPIPILKISDHPDIEEDEPAINYDGVHHAREPLGQETCLLIIEHLLNNYTRDEQVQFWVDNIEFYFIPCLNPEGYKYITNENLEYPYWRKNQRDNNENDVFDPAMDGVDLNRNYNSFWDGGDPSMASWVYRGPEPFSEAETQLKRDHFLDQKPVLSLSYHTYGEVTVYPLTLGFFYSPDRFLLAEIASEVGSRIEKIGGGTYLAVSGDCSVGQSPCWSYRVTGTFEILIEEATVFIPPGPEMLTVAENNLSGALYIPERVFGPGVVGHVTCASTNNPLAATYKVLEIYDTIITPRTAGSQYGRYHRLLQPGTYTFEFSMDGYETQTIEDVEVGEDTLTVLDVQMMPFVGVEELQVADCGLDIWIHPNPLHEVVKLTYKLTKAGFTEIGIYDITGRRIAVLVSETRYKGEHELIWNQMETPPGLYFLNLRANGQSVTEKLIVR